MFVLGNYLFGSINVTLAKVIISSIMSTYLYYTFPDNIDPIYGYHESAMVLFHFVFGYFIYELFSELYKREHLSAIIHAILSICAYLPTIFGYFVKYGLFFLSYDISTIFLNMTNRSNNIIWKILFAISFFLCRIVIGTYETIKFINHVYTLDNKYFNLIIVVSILFIVLNYFWFYKIIKKVIKINNSKSKH
jgi:hypothetical protein